MTTGLVRLYLSVRTGIGSAARMVGVSKVVGVHFDTFGFIKIDQEKAIEAFKEAGMTLNLLDIGATIEM